MTYTESASRTRFHDFVGTLSGSVLPTFELVPGMKNLFSHSNFPGFCFKRMDPLSGGRGLRGLALIRSNGDSAVLMMGSSLDRNAENWVPGAEPYRSLILDEEGFGQGPSLSTSRFVPWRTAMVAYGSPGSSSRMVYKRTFSRMISHHVNLGYLSKVSNMVDVPPFTHVMEVVGNYTSGLVGRIPATYITAAGASDPWFARADSANLVTAGYVSRSLGLGKFRHVMALSTVKDAVLAEYPEHSGIRARAASLYDATLAAGPNPDLSLALYYDVERERAYFRSRLPTIQRRTAPTNDDRQEDVYVGGNGSEFEGVIHTEGLDDTSWRPAANFGDANTVGAYERWLLSDAQADAKVNVRDAKLGPIVVDVVVRSMLPLLPPRDPIPTDVNILEMYVPLGSKETNGLETLPSPALAAGTLRSDFKRDVEIFDTVEASNSTPDNFHKAVMAFADGLDTAVENSFQ